MKLEGITISEIDQGKTKCFLWYVETKIKQTKNPQNHRNGEEESRCLGGRKGRGNREVLVEECQPSALRWITFEELNVKYGDYS